MRQSVMTKIKNYISKDCIVITIAEHVTQIFEC